MTVCIAAVCEDFNSAIAGVSPSYTAVKHAIDNYKV